MVTGSAGLRHFRRRSLFRRAPGMSVDELSQLLRLSHVPSVVPTRRKRAASLDAPTVAGDNLITQSYGFGRLGDLGALL